MLTAILFTLDATLGDALREVSNRCRQIGMGKIVTKEIQNYEAIRLMNSLDPDVILVDFAEPAWAGPLAEVLSNHSARSAVVGILPRGTPRHPEDRSVHVWLELPCRETDLDRVCVDAVVGVQKREDRPFFTFLPAKAGSGATTVALHVADALANQLKHRTLLIDSDLRSGVISLLLNLPQQKSLRDALASAADLQPVQWRQHVCIVENLEVLASRPEQQGPLPTWPDCYKLLQFSAPRYEAIVADLPELVNDATQELLRLSRRVLVVTTAELPALKLAARRVEELARRGSGSEQVGLLLNRWHRKDMPVEEVEKLVSCPVFAVIPNDYRAVQKAIPIGGFVNPKTGLGRAYGELAARLWSGQGTWQAALPRSQRVLTWLVS